MTDGHPQWGKGDNGYSNLPGQVAWNTTRGESVNVTILYSYAQFSLAKHRNLLILLRWHITCMVICSSGNQTQAGWGNIWPQHAPERPERASGRKSMGRGQPTPGKKAMLQKPAPPGRLLNPGGNQLFRLPPDGALFSSPGADPQSSGSSDQPDYTERQRSGVFPGGRH